MTHIFPAWSHSPPPVTAAIVPQSWKLGEWARPRRFSACLSSLSRFSPLGIPHSFFLCCPTGDDDGKPVVPAQLVTHVPYAVIRPFVGNVLVMIYEVDRAENNVIMDMSLVNVRREYILMLPLCYCVGKLPPDLMGFLIVHFPRRKGLYQVKG